MNSFVLKTILLLFFISGLIIIDQFFKLKIRTGGGFFVCNKGISFGIFLPNIIFWLIWLLLLFFLIYILFLKRNRILREFFPYFLILTGALSNIIDRLFFGCVFDYIYFINIPFPVFNLADIYIFIGILFFILFLKQKTV